MTIYSYNNDFLIDKDTVSQLVHLSDIRSYYAIKQSPNKSCLDILLRNFDFEQLRRDIADLWGFGNEELIANDDISCVDVEDKFY